MATSPSHAAQQQQPPLDAARKANALVAGRQAAPTSRNTPEAKRPPLLKANSTGRKLRVGGAVDGRRHANHRRHATWDGRRAAGNPTPSEDRTAARRYL